MPDPQPAARDGPRLLEELRHQLHQAALALTTAGEWARCLQLAAAMPGQPFSNILLISAAYPGPALVRGYAQWHKAGRQVRRGEPGTRVFDLPRVPARPPWLPGRDGTPEPPPGPAPGWRDAERVVVVWDITQTDGPPVTIRQPAPASSEEGAGKLRDGLCWLARRAGYAVNPGQVGQDGDTSQARRRITVPDGPSPRDGIQALAHQLGHALIHQPASRVPGGACCAGARRAEAQSAAYIVLTRYGLAVPPGFSPPSSWAGTDPRAQPAAAIIAAGERVTAATAGVIAYLDRVMPARTITLGATARAPAAARARQPAPGPGPGTAPRPRTPSSQRRAPKRRSPPGS